MALVAVVAVSFISFAVATLPLRPDATVDAPHPLKYRVEGLSAKPKLFCEGVSLCTGRDFTGDCLWGCYSEATIVYYARPYNSVRLDRPGACLFLGGTDCNPISEFPSQIVHYPGGNFGPDVADKTGCFNCTLAKYLDE